MTTLILINPEYVFNVATAVRAMACFVKGPSQVYFTGDRVLSLGETLKHLPREERLRVYNRVHWERVDRPFDLLDGGCVPVGIEVVRSAMLLPNFVHPKGENIAYVFGPEDDSLDRAVKGQCHHIVRIPMLTCANLGLAIGITLYDRMSKMPPELWPSMYDDDEEHE